MTAPTTLPKDINGLIKLLDQVFALKHYPPSATLAEIQRDLGKRDAVEFVKSLQREHMARLNDRD